jgi:8-oxo-dGTP pyrophosphatase MutT (NUDIX family)
MWIFTTFGFFSIVQKTGEQRLTVRARASEDLDRLRADYMPELSATVTGAGTDYPHRAFIEREALAGGLSRIAGDLRYPNFKTEVARVLGGRRAHLYGRVWEDLLALQEQEEAPGRSRRSPRSRPGVHARRCGAARDKAMAYGGVVVDSDGRVLLREPRGHFDGYVWTFPKGRPDGDEEAEQTAAREVLEETGTRAEIEARIDGTYEGGTTHNAYFLMQPVEETGILDGETASVRWAAPDEARNLIATTTNARGRERDLAVLEAALALWRSRRGR